MDAKIQEYRARIDALDDDLIRLLNQRAQLALEVGGLKRCAGTPLRDAERESQVLMRTRLANIGPLDDEAINRIFQCIIDESRGVEEMTA